MKCITYHWTAGTYKPNSTDLKHYHYLIGKDGEIYNGKFSPKDNENCSDGKYAAHCGGGNTGNIGIAYCGMCGFTSQYNVGKYPLTAKQVEAGFKLGAELVKEYNLDINKKHTIQTHYGFGQRNPKTSSFGKIDITYLPPYSDIPERLIEDFIANKVHWYIINSKEK